MATTYVHRLRYGNPMPILGLGSTAEGAVMYTFGNECQKIITCSNDNTVAKSEEFCLMGGDYWSASYRALPAKVGSSVRYNATITFVPVIGMTVQCPTGGNCDLIDF